MTPPTTLVLAAPDWHALDTLARRADPPVLWPVGTQSLAAHWLDHAVRLGCKEVVLYCPDRPADVRAALEGGAYWSVKLDLRPSVLSRRSRAAGEPHSPTARARLRASATRKVSL